MIEAHFSLHKGDFSLEAEMSDSGMILLTGKNGAGKSTFLLCLLGQRSPDSGRMALNGRELADLPTEKRRVAFVNQSTFGPHWDVEKHLIWGAGRIPPDTASISDARKGLGIDYGGKVGRLSLGQKIRVAIATAVLSSPEALLIDEALSNLSERLAVLSWLREWSVYSKTDIVYVSQDQSESNFADHHYVIEEGRMSRKF